jgi:hypothetical protein
MSNLTVVIDDELLRAARIKALQQGTSVNEICREAIARFAAPAETHDDFMAQLRAVANKIGRAKGAQPAWSSRDAMYEEAMAERMPTLWATLQNKPPR